MNPYIGYGIFAFLLGSVPFGLLVAHVFKLKDLRERGSGNIGATNVSRVLGFWPAGFLTFVLDFLKGVIPVFLLQFESTRDWIGHIIGYGGRGFEPNTSYIWFTGFLAVLGHCYSPWLKFHGGKGVSTGLGVILVLSPVSAVAAALVYALVFTLTGIGSISSLMAIAIASAVYLILNPFGPHVWAGALMVAVIFLRHEANISALLEKRERAF